MTLERTSALATDTSRAEKVALQIIVSNSARAIARLEGELGSVIVPQVDADIEALRAAHAADGPCRAGRGRADRQPVVAFLSSASGRTARRRRRPPAPPSSTTMRSLLAVRAIFDPIERRAHSRRGSRPPSPRRSPSSAQTSFDREPRRWSCSSRLSRFVAGGAVVALLDPGGRPAGTSLLDFAFARRRRRGESERGRDRERRAGRAGDSR